jgi:3-oxoadipate enol-lactonase
MPTVTLEEGTRVHCLDAGSGAPPVVLLHAFPLHSGMWEPQVAALRDRFRVVAPDLPGFGASDGPDDPTAYSMERYADLTAALLDRLGVERGVVGGLSMGGYVALAFLRRHRARLAGLVLADTRADVDTPEIRERRTRQQRQVGEEGTAALVDSMLEVLLSEDTRKERPEVVETARRLMDNPAAGVIGALDAMKRRADASGDLAGIDVPTLVVVGEHDGPSPPSVAEEMHARIPRSRLAVIPGAGHLSNLEAPAVFNQALLAFLDDL